jgi:DNA gyrase/topoisomerase IV subunit A
VLSDEDRQSLTWREAVIAGLVTAVDRRSEVVELLADADDAAAATAGLQRLLGIDETAAVAVLDLQFRRLTNRDRQLLRAELEDIRSKLANG